MNSPNRADELLAALILLASDGRKQITIPAEILTHAKEHFAAGHTLMLGEREGDVVIGWVRSTGKPGQAATADAGTASTGRG